ncbi:MAG TPA: esterase [Myxococcales bacterium]|nr:esterase [Myxococcales bacterium]HAN31909.1 esterase [Myxococcales bacterium]
MINRSNIGGLDVLEVPGEPGGLTVVLLHGFGASWEDLLPLHRVIAAPPGTRWIFPNAPVEVALGPWMSGRAWFPIDMDALNRAMMSGTHRDMSSITPAGLSEARDQVLAMLAELDADRVILGGFSQGAMVSVEVASSGVFRPEGLIVMSGTLLHESVWKQALARLPELAFIQSHGRADPLLGLEAAQRLHAVLTETGHRGHLHEFDGQHEIPAQIIEKIGAFILQQCDRGEQPPAATE